jgi:hypothetical protein
VTRTIALFAALTLTAFAVAGSATTSATSPPSADMFAIDLDIDGPPANTATSVGTIVPCAIIFNNGVLDADEDAVDAKDLDIVTGYSGIPAANAMKAYGYALHYPAPELQITSQTPMLIESPGSNPVNNSDPLPDADGAFVANVSDPFGPAESGPGVLDRLHIESTGLGVQGVFPLSISNASHTDTADQSHVPDAIQSALIIIDTVGCGWLTDLEMMNHSASFPSEIAAGFPRTISIDGELYNHQPGGAPFSTIDAVTTLTIAGDCTANGESSPVVITSTEPMPSFGTSESFEHSADIVCATGGPASITVESCSSPQLGADIYTPNDCATEVVNFNVDAGDTDGDGFSDEDEVGTPLCNGINDDNDDDAIVDDGCLGGPPQAGAFSEAQFQIGTNWLVACTPGGSINVWPAELAIGSVPDSTNIINIGDLVAFVAPVRRLGTSPGDPNFDERYDLSPGHGGPANWINVLDLVALVTLKPPIQPFAGTRAFSGPPAC